MTVAEKYEIDRAHECKSVFKTTDAEHPGVGDGHAAGRGESRRPRAGALRRRVQGEVWRALHDPGADARANSSARLVARRGVPDAQPDAPLARVPRQGGDRGVRRRAGALAARQPQGRRHPGRRADEGDRGADREVLSRRHRRPVGLSARHALCRAARGAAARAIPPELRLLAPDRRARPRRRRQLLRPVRRAQDLRRDPARLARDPAVQDRL